MPARKKSKNSRCSSQSGQRKDENSSVPRLEQGRDVVDLTNMKTNHEPLSPNDMEIAQGTSPHRTTHSNTRDNVSISPQKFTEDDDWHLLQMVQEAEELYEVVQENVSMEMKFLPSKQKHKDENSFDPPAPSSSFSEECGASSMLSYSYVATLDGIDDPLPEGLLDALEKAERQLAPAPTAPSPPPTPSLASTVLVMNEDIHASKDLISGNFAAAAEKESDLDKPMGFNSAFPPPSTAPLPENPNTSSVQHQPSSKPPLDSQVQSISPNPPGGSDKTSLTVEQRLKMEENRRKAKERKEKREREMQQQQQQSSYRKSYPPPPSEPAPRHSSTASTSQIYESSSSSSSLSPAYSLLPNKRPLPDASTTDYFVDSGSSLDESQPTSMNMDHQYNHHRQLHQHSAPKLHELPADSFPPISVYSPFPTGQIQQQRPHTPKGTIGPGPSQAEATSTSSELFSIPNAVPTSILSRCMIYNWPQGATAPLSDKRYEVLGFVDSIPTRESPSKVDIHMKGGKDLIIYCVHSTFRKNDNYALYLAAKVAWDHGAALLAIIFVDDQAENDLSKCMELHRSSAEGEFQSGLLDSVENSFIRKNVNSLSAKSSFASSLQEMGISVIGLVGHGSKIDSNVASSGSSGAYDAHHDLLPVDLLMSCIEKITSSGEYNLRGLISDFTGHPALHHMNRKLTMRLPHVPHIAVDSSSLLSHPHKPAIDYSGPFAEFLKSFVAYVSEDNVLISSDIPDVIDSISTDRQEDLRKFLNSCLPVKGPRVVSAANSPFKVSFMDWKRVNAALHYHSTCIISSDKFSLWSEASAHEQLDKLTEDFAAPRGLDEHVDKEGDILTGAAISIVNMVHAGIISSTCVLRKVQSMSKFKVNVNVTTAGTLASNDILNSLIYYITWMEYGVLRAKILLKDANYMDASKDDGVTSRSGVKWFSMLTRKDLDGRNPTMNVFSAYKMKCTKKFEGSSHKLMTPTDFAHGKTGDALFDCIQNVLVHYGFEPSPGPVLYYWLATLCLRLPSIQLGLNIAICQIATHSLHSAETSPFLVPSILNAMTEINSIISSDDKFQDESGEIVDILNVLRNIIIDQVGSKLRLEYLLSAYCKAAEVCGSGS